MLITWRRNMDNNENKCKKCGLREQCLNEELLNNLIEAKTN